MGQDLIKSLMMMMTMMFMEKEFRPVQVHSR